MTSPQSWETVLFALALEKPAHLRPAFLDAECEGDPDLRQRLEALLAAHEEPESLAGPNRWVQLDDEPAPAEQVGSLVGCYKLLEKLGVGGFGEVWAAEQNAPVRRRVALKVIKLGMDTKQVVARFEAERQALAMMDHPNIAKVLDVGTTDVGRPFFVMELVRGIRITDYCDQANLTTKERLDLFIKVCQAIQHAHQKGIIHRDIKPSNILVTLHDGVPVPKVIDFGIAKATVGRLTDATVYTQLHQFIGTPAYMSPEQAEMSGLDIDTRSDIYSLGVLLYELLAGSTPFDAKELMSGGIDAMRRTIREKEPQRPSTKLSQTLVAADVRRLKSAASDTPSSEEEVRASSRRLLRVKETITLLKGDLDWIVMKCLEKDRQRRYETANGIAADLKRHLNNEPVVARPPSAAYKFQKAVRRNKLVFAAGTAVAIALVAGLCLAALGWRQTRVERDNAQAALHFIQDDVLSQASPGSQPNRELTVRALLDRVADRLDHASGRPPLVEASIRQTLGSGYTELGAYEKAVQHYERALQLQLEHLDEDSPDTLRSVYGLAMARWWSGSMVQADELTRRGLETSRRILVEKDPITLQFMRTRASTMVYSGAVPWAEIEPLFLQALALHREVLGPTNSATFQLIYDLGLGYAFNFQPAMGAPLVAEALIVPSRWTNNNNTRRQPG